MQQGDKQRKPRKGQKQTHHAGEPETRHELTIPVFRSPALDALRHQKRLSVTSSHRKAKQASARRRKVSTAEVATRSLHQVGYSMDRQQQLPLLQSRTSKADVTPSPPSEQQGGWRVGLRNLLSTWSPTRPASPVIDVSPISEEEQQKLAELEMRLPRVAGKIDPVLLIAALALLCIGLVMVYSASSFVSTSFFGEPSYYFQKQLFGAVMGIIAMFITMRIDYRQWRRFSLIGMALIFPLMIAVLIVGTNAYGASRWLTIGSFLSFQPSELTKLVLALYIADWLARKGNQVGSFLYGLTPFVILMGAVLALVFLQRDMGTAIVIASLAVAMFFTAGANIFQFLLALACGGLVFIYHAFQGYRYYRLLGFLDPFSHIDSLNLQLYQSLLALGSGGFFGVGLGASRQKTGYLPLPHIDSIFAIVGEELGFLGSATVIFLFLVLAFRGLRLVRRSQDLYGALLASGITTWLVIQAMVNIGATTGAIPYTGVPLPFISYGGSSLFVSLAAVGVLLNISRYTQEPEISTLARYTGAFTTKKKRVSTRLSKSSSVGSVDSIK